jgi:hypothetical protein
MTLWITSAKDGMLDVFVCPCYDVLAMIKVEVEVKSQLV